MKKALILVVLLMFTACTAETPPGIEGNAPDVTHSELWGVQGELWAPESRLPDFSYAGYKSGEEEIPKLPVKANVKDFGAVGDGETDDTQAFLDAIDAVENGAVFIPEGRYLITKVLGLQKDNIVLRGAGPDKTVLGLLDPLEEVIQDEYVYPIPHNEKQSPFSHRNGFIAIGKWCDTAPDCNMGEKLADVTKNQDRGVHELTISGSVEQGQTVMLVQTDPGDKSLLSYLTGVDKEFGNLPHSPKLTKFVSKVASVNGDKITFERPLRTEIRTEWQPELYVYEPLVEHVGVEDLKLFFPAVPAAEHLQEPGYNGIDIIGASNCWVTNVHIQNGDNGIALADTRFCTLKDILLVADDERFAQGVSGHHGIDFKTWSGDNLLTDFAFDTEYSHDISVTSLANGNVIANGVGRNMNFDHHKGPPYENLFTNIDTGRGTRVWKSSGDPNAGPHAGVRSTYWNIRGGADISWPPEKAMTGKGPWGPEQMNLVGIGGVSATQKSCNEQWFETGEVEPVNLYEAQLETRLNPPGDIPSVVDRTVEC